LREVLAYPQKVASFQEADFATALSRLTLERLVPMLDETRRWDRDLTQDEQLNLAFARMVLQKPQWVLMDDVFGVLDDESLERVTDAFGHELSKTCLIHIGKAAQAHHPIFSRVLHLIKPPPRGDGKGGGGRDRSPTGSFAVVSAADSSATGTDASAATKTKTGSR